MRPVSCPWLAVALAALTASESAAVETVGYGEVFPPDNPWNVDISNLPVHANSANYVASIGTGLSLHPDFGTVYGGEPWGIPFDVVPGTQAKVAITFVAYPTESDPGPYPMPPDCPIEGGSQLSNTGDRHALVIDKDHHLLYELDNAFLNSDGSWTADGGAMFNLDSNALRPAGWTSADAAGLPIFAGLARYDEVAAGAIRHAIRFAVTNSQKAYIYPARHDASSNTSTSLPPMGLRFRLKASFDTSGLTPQALIVATTLKRYGMMVADNGGNWFIGGAPDPGWNDADINNLKSIHGSDFEVVDTSMMDPSTNTVPPTVPTGLAVSGGVNQATLSWNPSAASYLLGYNVFTAAAASGPWSLASAAPIGTTSCTLTGLSGGATMWFAVTAEDFATNQSAQSAPASAMIAGGATTTAAGTTGGASGSSGTTSSGAATAGGGTAPSGSSGGGGHCGFGGLGIALLGMAGWRRLRRHGQ
jgi:hypothetical protein